MLCGGFQFLVKALPPRTLQIIDFVDFYLFFGHNMGAEHDRHVWTGDQRKGT